MRPNGRKGDDIVIPDNVALMLVNNGEAEDPRPYPPPDVAPAPAPEQTRPKLSLKRPKDYFTRNKRAAT